MRLLENDETPFVKAALYGKPGTGKTSIGVTAPKPLILLSEQQGKLHIKKAAKRLGIEEPQTILMQDLDDYRAVVRALHGDKSKPLQIKQWVHEGDQRKQVTVLELDWPETVVIDSLTDAARLVVEDIRRQSPPKRGKDGLPADGQRFWSVLGDRMKNLIYSYRDAPVHTLFLCLADDREIGDEDNKVRSVTPDLPMRRLPDTLAAAVNFIGYTFRKQTRKPKGPAEIEYGVLTVGPEYMTLKPYRPLRDVEVPNFTTWVRMVHGELAPEDVKSTTASQEYAEAIAEVDQPIQVEEDEPVMGEQYVTPEGKDVTEQVEEKKADKHKKAKASKRKNSRKGAEHAQA